MSQVPVFCCEPRLCFIRSMFIYSSRLGAWTLVRRYRDFIKSARGLNKMKRSSGAGSDAFALLILSVSHDFEVSVRKDETSLKGLQKPE